MWENDMKNVTVFSENYVASSFVSVASEMVTIVKAQAAEQIEYIMQMQQAKIHHFQNLHIISMQITDN